MVLWARSTILILPPSTLLSQLKYNVFSGLLTILKFVLTFVQVFYGFSI